MTENLAEDQGPNLIKKGWSPQSFSNRTVRPEKLHILMEAAGAPDPIRTSSPGASSLSLVKTRTATTTFWHACRKAMLPGSDAPVLMLSVARLNFESDGARNKHAFRDLAQAVSNIRKIPWFVGIVSALGEIREPL